MTMPGDERGLLPCICGAPAKRVDYPWYLENTHHVICGKQKCSACSPGFATPEQAAKWWNKAMDRAYEKAMDQLKKRALARNNP